MTSRVQAYATGFGMLASLALIATAIVNTNAAAQSSSELVLRSELKFISLNPARGDAAPQAGVLWGDIRKDVPSGVLLKFASEFSSPPHIHNITYRAVVISGALHNDDPTAKTMWMGPGSFWTQPAGEDHITSAGQGGATAFLEIMKGPYLVQPSTKAYDNGERPVNVEARNIVWLSPSDAAWVNAGNGKGPKIAFLWGELEDGKKNGTFLKLPTGYNGKLSGNSSQLRAVVIRGEVEYAAASGTKTLKPGSYFGSKGAIDHGLACKEECIIYVRTEGRYKVDNS
ncbi:MAG: DUF4437 domain-containing protein [Hyphomicrobiaceae bacterium]